MRAARARLQVFVGLPKERMTRDGSTDRDAELRALERAMGAVMVEESQEWGGEIAGDDDDDSDRDAVVYDDDALFDDDDPPPPHNEERLESALTDPADLAGLLGDGGAESTSALIAYLEEMAAGLEAQSGEEEREIRGKIAVLRSVLEARSGVVSQSLARFGDGQGGGPDEEGALESLEELASESLQRIEHGMGAVDSLLQDDDARQLLAESAHVWMPAIGVTPQAGGEREHTPSAD